MKTLGRNPRVIRLARDLGLPTSGDCLTRILEFALNEVARMMAGFPVSSLDDLRRIVCNRLSLKVEWIVSGADVNRIAEEYADFHSALRQRLRMEFLEGTTEGITLERDGFAPGQFEFLGVIDARGERAVRAYFTTWHEITHLIIEPVGEDTLLFRRTPSADQIKKNPVESVVDHVAGHLAFYPHFFEPVIRTAIADRGRLTFGAIEEARRQVAPDASLFATAIRCISYAGGPTLLVCVEPALKRGEERALRSPQQAFEFAQPIVQPKLRATSVIPNEHVRSETFEIRQNMRIPERSVLAQAFASGFDVTVEAHEDQGWWETSQSGPLSPRPIWVEAVRRGRFVYGLISLGPVVDASTY